MSPGNIKLSVSTVIPCKQLVSQLFRNFDFLLEAISQLDDLSKKDNSVNLL